MKNIPEIEEIIEELLMDQNIEQCIVSTIDGSPIFGKSKKKDISDEIYVLPAAVSSALAISQGFLDSTLKDQVHEYIVFQERSILIASRASDTILITTICIPKSSFEKRPEIDALVKRIQEIAAKINAIVKTLDIEDSIIEKIQRAIPEAKAIMLLSSAGIPITELLSNLNVDTAQLAAVSSALSLPTRVLGGESKSIAVTGEKNLILLYSLDQERILMVALKPKHSVESYLTIISRTVSH
ncbi:MAG: hypothetical protein EAX86_05960 [Candidatus Heimdallarchaeota archaeon]|nr:hypothetical protein [Candidatus Heimdallarchaeota archaeon]